MYKREVLECLRIQIQFCSWRKRPGGRKAPFINMHNNNNNIKDSNNYNNPELHRLHFAARGRFYDVKQMVHARLAEYEPCLEFAVVEFSQTILIINSR